MNIPNFIFIYMLLFILYILAVGIIQSKSISTLPSLSILIIFAVSFRISLITSTPSLSNDIYRYLWDGKVSSGGINPYRFPPSSPKLKYLQDENYKKMDHRNTFTCYPPLAQLLFKLAYKIYPSVCVMKILFVLFDLGNMLLLILILRLRKENLLKVIMYAWNPLAVIETAGSGHLDSFAIFWILLALFFYYKKKTLFSMSVLLISSLSKFFALPAFLFHIRKVRFRQLIFLCIFAFLLYLPFIDAGKNIIKGPLTYLTLWEFNGSLFPAILHLTSSYLLSKILIFFIFVSLIVRLAIKDIPFPKAIFMIFGAMILLSPVVYPWYLLWTLPFLCFNEKLSWTVLSGTIILSYSVLTPYFYIGQWQEVFKTRVWVYLPFYSLLSFEAARLYFRLRKR